MPRLDRLYASAHMCKPGLARSAGICPAGARFGFLQLIAWIEFSAGCQCPISLPVTEKFDGPRPCAVAAQRDVVSLPVDIGC